MRGHIRQQGRDSWQITVDRGKDASGKRLRYFETFRARKKSDAQNRLNEILVNFDKGIYIPPGRLTVAEHLNNWLEGYVKTNCSQRTLDGYQSIIERHLVPAIGHIQLKHLQPPAIQKYYGQAVSKLSHRTVHHQHRVLSQSLKYAVRQGYLVRNPCELVDAPAPRKKAMRTLTPSEVETLLSCAAESYYYPVIYTALNTGMRQAELLGLRWRDVDLDMLSISVCQVLYKRRGVCVFKEPKTIHSRRRVAMTPKLAQYLREYRKTREDICYQIGKVLSLDDLLFSSALGKPIDPCVVTHAMNRIAAQAGLKGVRFHDLRHTFASLMLLRGAKPKVISEALGHASVAFTMDVYSHIINGMQEDAMELLNEIMPSGVTKKSVAEMSRNLSSLDSDASVAQG